MIQKIFKKRSIAGIGGLLLFFNHLGLEFMYSYKAASIIVIAIFIGILYLNIFQKIQKEKWPFSRIMAENLQVCTAAFFSFLIILLLVELMLNFGAPNPIDFKNKLRGFLPVMVNEAYKKAIFFIPLSFLFGIIFSLQKPNVKNEDILDEDLEDY